MTKNDYLKTATEIVISVGGIPQKVAPRPFSTGSVGYNFSSKVQVQKGAAAVPVEVAGIPMAATPTKKNPENYYGTQRLDINGVRHTVGANVSAVKGKPGTYQATVNVTANGSKTWDGAVTAPAAKPKAATADIAPPAGPRVLTEAAAAAEFREQSLVDPNSVGAVKFGKMLNKWANSKNIVISH